MTLILALADFFLHLDVNLSGLAIIYGPWIYGLLFLVIFLETGFVVTPFLPGDSLLFVAGALAATGVLNPWTLALLLAAAAIAGDASNYWIGRRLGPRIFYSERRRLFRKEYLERTRVFYVKYGPKTIILARFVPIVRTFAPFVAGIGQMRYGQFAVFNIIGGVSWVGLFFFGGFLFGNIPAVRERFALVVLVIIVFSVLLGVLEYRRSRRSVV